MHILIIRGNIDTPKSYPYWEELLVLLKDHEIKEIKGILSEQETIDLVNWADVVVTIDTFLPHMIKYHNLKTKVICLWGKSNPVHFGYPENINLHLGKFRMDQYRWWKDVKWEKEDFVDSKTVFNAINML